MRKYWYYTYQTGHSIGCGVNHSDNGEFDVTRTIDYLSEAYNLDSASIVITNWKEISSSLYEKLFASFDSSKATEWKEG